MKQKYYKISFENTEDITDSYYFFSSTSIIIDMMSCRSTNNKIANAKTGEVFTIREKVFEALNITEQDLKDLNFEE